MVQIETALLIALLGFVLGFFCNILAMRRMFVGKGEFDGFKKAQVDAFAQFKTNFEERCDLKRASCASIGGDIAEIKGDIKELFRLLRDSVNSKR